MVITLAGTAQGAVAEEDKAYRERKEILVLNSYTPDSSWTSSMLEAITQTINSHHLGTNFYIEHLDALRQHDPAVRDAFGSYLQSRYMAIPLDLIIATDDVALQYVIEHHGKRLPAIPTVFAGVSVDSTRKIPAGFPTTGVTDTFDFRIALDLARQLRPDAQAVHVFGNTQAAVPTSGPRTAQSYLEALQYDLPIKFYYDLSVEQMREIAAQLPHNDFYYSLAIGRSSDGLELSFYEVQEALAQVASAAPFAFWSPEGMPFSVGGAGTPLSQGEEAARLALRVLRADAITTIPISESPLVMDFNYALLTRHGISETHLPPGSTVLDRPPTLYEQYTWQVWTAVAVFVAMTTLISGLLINITRRRIAETAQSATQNYLNITFDSIIHGILIFDENLRLKIWNKHCESMGLDPTMLQVSLPMDYIVELAGRGLGLTEEEITSYRKSRIAAMQARESLSTESIQLTDGRMLDTEYTYLEGGGIAVLFTDVTDQRTAEAGLRQFQKMEAVGQLTGGIAHDFNNLLMIVSGNLELLANRHPEIANDRELLRSAASAAERGAALTQRLLAFSRKQALEPQSIDVNQLLVNMEDLLRRTLEESIDLEFVKSGGLWRCEADPNQVENAILNLAINARDAMPDGGKLTIETANARLDEAYAQLHDEVVPGQYVALSVSDTGCGIPEEFQGMVVEPFFTTKEVGRGSGLGLSMVYGFIKQSNGHLSIYSEADEGTTIRMYLPRTSKDTTQATVAPVGDFTAINQESVLVVEDDKNVRGVVVKFLEELGYKHFVAVDAASALKQLRAFPDIDLLLTDVVLPGGMGGADLARECAKLRPNVRIVFMSGYTENAIVHHGRLDQDTYLLHKPFSQDELGQKLRSILSKPD